MGRDSGEFATTDVAEANRARKVELVVRLLRADGIGAAVAGRFDPATRRAVERRAGCGHASGSPMTWDAILRELAKPSDRSTELGPAPVRSREARAYVSTYGPPS